MAGTDKGGGRSVLVVDGPGQQSEQLSRVLEAAGFAAAQAGSGAEAIGMARQARPDLVLIEAEMPGMDGYELCGRIKDDDSLRGVAVALLTTLSCPEDVIRGLDSGADGYISKPLSPELLISKVRALVACPARVVNSAEQRRMEIDYCGKRLQVRAGRAQTVSFLLSACEDAMMRNRELGSVHDELKRLNERLEEKVRERTGALLAEVGERREAEQALTESKDRFRALIELASDAVIGLRPPGVIYLWNRKAEEMFGYKAQEALDRDLHGLIVPERYREKAYAGLKGFFETGHGGLIGKTIELSGMRRDGSELPVEVSISAFNIRGEWNTVGIIRDISGRKRLEERMAQNLDDVERMNRLMVGRELRMEDLRDEVRRLRLRVKELEEAREARG